MAKQARAAQPDAWLKLVLQSMSVTELRAELENASDKSAEELRLMTEELRRKERI